VYLAKHSNLGSVLVGPGHQLHDNAVTTPSSFLFSSLVPLLFLFGEIVVLEPTSVGKAAESFGMLAVRAKEDPSTSVWLSDMCVVQQRDQHRARGN
jgi:hypothetical protein